MADSTNNINIQISNSIDAGIAPRLIEIADASDRAQATIGSLKQQLESIGSLNLSSLQNSFSQVANSQRSVASATQGTVSANVSAAASFGLLEGRTLSMNRAAANFATRIIGLGPLLQAAFPIIGAIALVDVLYQMGSGLAKTVKAAENAGREIAKAFDSVLNPLRRTNDELQYSNDRLDAQIAKLQHRPTTNGPALALDEARVMADRLEESLERVSNEIDSILNKNQINFLGSLLTGQSTTGDTSKFLTQQFDQISKARDEAQAALDKAAANGDSKAAHSAMLQAYENERNAIKGVTRAIEDQYNKTSQLQSLRSQSSSLFSAVFPTLDKPTQDQTANLTALGKAGHLAEQELRNLDLTMSNVNKQNALDHLRDQASDLKTEAKLAAQQWKELEASFVKFQADIDKTGHRATPEQSLSFLQSRESTINPLNRDKLTAKELPFENQIAGNQWIADQTQKLTDQVATIGLYSNALKEAADANKIFEEAARKNITVSDDVKSKIKGLISTIVEYQEYSKQLESIYRGVDGAAATYQARLRAVSTLFEGGVLSSDQFAQGIKQTVKEYDEASSAVAKFRRELSDAERDASNKLGTQRQIAVKESLQGLSEQLRKPGADSAHPFGYSEAEIARINSELSPLIEAMQRKNAVDQETNKLLNQQDDLMDQLSIKEAARANALKAGAISQDAANAANMKDRLTLNQSQLASGNLQSGSQPFSSAIMDYGKEFQSLAQGIENSFQPVFRTLSDGFADSLGRAVVYGKNLGSALRDVARSAISELLSGLIKLGEQYVINAVMGQTAAAAATASSSAQASVLSATWAPAAFAASVATMGAADGIGLSAYTSGLMTSLAMTIPKLATGTNVVPDDMFAMIHKDERVIPAADNRELISTLQSQRDSNNNSPGMHVEVHNYSGNRVDTEQMSEGRVRVIVRSMGTEIVSQHAPGVIAQDLQNPNSKTSKALARNTYSTRQR